MPLPTPLQPRIPTPQSSQISRFDVVSRFDIQPKTIPPSKRPKQSPLSSNPLSDSDSSSSPEPPKKKTFQKYGEVIGQTKDELQRRDRRMQRFNDIAERATPPRVDTPDYMRDVQIAASIVNPPLHSLSLVNNYLRV